MKPDPAGGLESALHRTLRALPDRPAPAGLESRVLAAIAARRAPPWWRQPFAHWPLAARAAFGGTSAVAAAAVLVAAFDLAHGLGLSSALAQLVAPLRNVRGLAATLTGSAGVVLRGLPSFWLYGVAALVVSLYAAFFGLSAAAYRILWPRS